MSRCALCHAMSDEPCLPHAEQPVDPGVAGAAVCCRLTELAALRRELDELQAGIVGWQALPLSEALDHAAHYCARQTEIEKRIAALEAETWAEDTGGAGHQVQDKTVDMVDALALFAEVMRTQSLLSDAAGLARQGIAYIPRPTDRVEVKAEKVIDTSHEETRVYHFPTDGDDIEVEVDGPLSIRVSESGLHHIDCADGVGMMIPPGWHLIEVFPRPGEIPFKR
jgi:hypothetical protein